ncbi:MAG: ATP-binding protein [Pyrinomonadaceae bacterium]
MEFVSDIKTLDIFENVFAFYGTLTAEGFVLNLEGKIFEQTSTDPQFLIGQKFSETVYWQSSEHTPNILEQSISKAAKGERSKTLLDFRVNSQEKVVIELFLHPLPETKYNPKQIFFCAQDVTEREKKIEHYKTRNEHLLLAAESAEIGLWFWELTEDKIFSTPKCNELLEIPIDNVITIESLLHIVHPEDLALVEAALRDSQLNGKEFHAEYRVIYSDGSIHWISARGKTYLDDEGNPKNMMGVVRKVTDKKLAREELSKVYAREKKARDEAEEANRAKDFFLAVVSHELRSPLNAILGWAKILLTREVDEETRRSALVTIEKSARSQAKLIEDLIDSARVASGKLRLELRPINLFEIIETVYNLQRPTAEAKKITLRFSADKENIQVFGDPMRLQQVFTNLLSNALKFTNEGGSVQISVQTDADLVKIAFRDNGQGISSDLLPSIFGQFQQGDETTSRKGSGLGLGLSIVKILIKKHKGQVLAESGGIGQGSTFTVTLPVYSQETDIPAEIEKSNSQENKLLDGIKILVVEDDQDSREVLQLFLEQNGAIVKSADSANKAISLLREAQPDLPNIIVSDLAMPDIDGYSLIKQIRSLPKEKGSKIPALALSAFASNENKRKALASGFQKYHTKPFEPDGIIEDIRELVDK